MPHSLIKNGKEHKNVVFFWKERMPNPGGDLFGEPDSAILSLSLWAGEWHVWESDSASCTLSLCVVYVRSTVVIQGRAQQILAEFVKETKLSLHWVPLLYIYISEEESDSATLAESL